MRLRPLVVFAAAALVPLAVAGVYLVDHGVVGTGRPEAAFATSTPPLPTSTTGPERTRGPVGEPSVPTVPAQTSPTHSSARAPLAATDMPTDPAGEAREPRYAFPIRDCAASYEAAHHHYPAADIFTGRGCTFVAPIAGRVTFVSRVDRWDPSTNAGADRGGLSVAITGVDGVQYYGSHLARVRAGIAPGKRVQTGQPLGLAGETGSARGTGPHLHFGISWPTSTSHWWIRRGVVSPQPFLDAWRHGATAAPSDGSKPRNVSTATTLAAGHSAERTGRRSLAAIWGDRPLAARHSSRACRRSGACCTWRRPAVLCGSDLSQGDGSTS